MWRFPPPPINHAHTGLGMVGPVQAPSLLFQSLRALTHDRLAVIKPAFSLRLVASSTCPTQRSTVAIAAWMALTILAVMASNMSGCGV